MFLHHSSRAQSLGNHTRIPGNLSTRQSLVNDAARFARRGSIALAFSLALFLGSFARSIAGPLTNLHNFNYSLYSVTAGLDGSKPNSLVLSGTTLYGTTNTGGAFDYGTIFKINTDGTGFQVLYDFGTAAADGVQPSGPIVLIGSTLYGTTELGGTANNSTNFESYGSGTLYKINTDGTGYEILHDFGTLSTDGTEPTGGLIASGTTLYGAATAGGTFSQGTVFKVNTDGSSYATLYDFGTHSPDGSSPTGALTLSGSTLYGVTSMGGADEAGTIYSLSTTGTGYKVLYSFGATGTDGVTPDSGLTLVGTVLWGTTLLGGADNVGTLYHIATNGTGYAQAHAFGASVPDGQYPVSGLTLVGSTLYGTTEYGGGTASDNGTIYQIATGGTGYATAYLFGAIDTDGEDAAIPALVSSGGVFYGAMGSGGVNGDGTVYSLNLAAAAPTWVAKAIAAGPENTSMELWTRSDGAAGLWALNAKDQVAAYGSVYGPYVDGSGTWTAQAVAVGSDGTSRVLWTRSDGAAGLWSFDSSGNATVIGAVYGPFAGYTARSVGVSGDGTSRVLWATNTGSAGIWLMDENDLESYIGKTYGPYANYQAVSLATDDSGYSRVLWRDTNGAAGIWTFDPLGNETVIGPTYSLAGYVATAVGATDDTQFGVASSPTTGDATMLWAGSTSSGGSSTIWTFDPTNTEKLEGPVYGPFANFAATAFSMAASPSELGGSFDGTSRVLFNETNGASGIWTFGTEDAENIIGTLYGPF